MSPDTLHLLGALRRIAQSLDTYSKTIEHDAGLTLPQLLLLEALRSDGDAPTAGRLAQRVSLTQGTVTSILDRLEARGLVRRSRANDDRRRVLVALTPRGRSLLGKAPPLMHADFLRGFAALTTSDRAGLLDAVDRIAALMRSVDTSISPQASASTAA
ncbi:MAG: MarR family winged helix-turn-helix transcriptional regulator [Sinimarinibacterium flocculans]|uniref:MarR family winged helix-turn-helix transcriptional regulator n=1 Tax=Sinimarinibacterium flocculans TaxID=985250 RepID=UPI003C6A259C